LETRTMNMADKQKMDCIPEFARWIESQEDHDPDLCYPREWSWVLDQIGLDAQLRTRLVPSDEPLEHQASHELRKHSYRLQAISLFGR
jgi:hypothetical protein